MMHEGVAVEEWLYSVLRPIGLPVWATTIPDDAPYPCFLFGLTTSLDVNGVGATRIMSELEYEVRVWDESRSWADIASYADDMDDALQGMTGEVTDGFVLGCVRIAPLMSKEQYDGVWYSGLGGTYRITAQGKEA